MKKKVLLVLVAMMAILQSAFAYDFSAVSPSGHTLYYSIQGYSGGNPVVDLTYPASYYTNPYSGYTSPTGNVVIPSTVTFNGTTYYVNRIGVGVFYNCTGLTSVTIPNTITFIGSNAFYGCSYLTEIISQAVVAPSLASNAFDGVSSSATVYVPCGSQMSYNSNWASLSGQFVLTGVYTIEATSLDNTMGTVNTIIEPTCEAPTAVIVAVAANGYMFDHWSDNNSDNPRTLTLTSDTTVVAYFVEMDRDTIFYHDTIYVPVHDTTTIFLRDTLITNTYDTSIYNHFQYDTTLVFDTMIVNVYNYDTSIYNNYQFDTVILNYYQYDTTLLNVYDTTIINIYDTTIVNNSTYTYDTSIYNHFQYDTTLVFDTMIVNVYTYDTSIYNNYQFDTVILNVYQYDTTIVNDTVINNYYQYDTTLVNVFDTTIVNVYDTTLVNIYDTTIVNIYDTTINNLYQYDTVIVNNYLYDTVIVNHYYYDTTIVNNHDTVNNYFYDTVVITHYYHDTVIVNNYVYDTIYLNRYIFDTIWMYDTIIVHDTIYITQEGIDGADALNAKVYASNGQIVVEGVEGQAVAIYDVMGRKLTYSSTADKQRSPSPILGEELRIDVPVSGTYLIKIGDYPARKVVVIR